MEKSCVGFTGAVVQELKEAQQVVILQLQLTHPELQLRRLHQFRELFQVDGAVPAEVHGLKQLLHLAADCGSHAAVAWIQSF